MLGPKFRDLTIFLPWLDIVAIYIPLCGSLGFFVIEAEKVVALRDVSVGPYARYAGIGHLACSYFGDRKPGEVSHSFMCVAVSACRALRNSTSRSLPTGSRLACSLRRRASSASRSPKVFVCMMRRLSLMPSSTFETAPSDQPCSQADTGALGAGARNLAQWQGRCCSIQNSRAKLVFPTSEMWIVVQDYT